MTTTIGDQTAPTPAPQVTGDGAQVPPNAAVAAGSPDLSTTVASPPPGSEQLTTEGEPSSQPSGPVADTRQSITEFATSLGYDPAAFAGYTSLEDAQAAVRSYAASLVQQGISPGFVPPPPFGQYSHPGGFAPQQPPYGPGQMQPAVPYPPPGQFAPPQSPAQLPSLDIKALGLDEDEPAAKAIRALEGRLTTAVSQITTAFEAQQSAAAESRRQARVQEARGIVDGFKSTRYGVGRTRSPEQSVNLQRLFDLSDSIAFGAERMGQPIPSLSERLSLAKMVDELQNAPVSPVHSATPAAPAVPAVTPPPAQVAQRPTLPAKSGGMLEKWSERPEVRALIGAN